MFTKRILRVILIAMVALLVVNINPGSAEKLSLIPLPAPAVDPVDMGSAFTYQGRLMDGSNPANGVYDFIFRLYDDAVVTPPVPIGTVVLDDYTVTNGLFMAELDFGADAFTGYERWLEIGVRSGSSSIPFTSLSPRQKINPAPYATFARTIYRKTVVVKPVTPAGSFTDNGKELLSALGDIGDASASNPYLLKIEPGIYDLAEDSLIMKPYVDVEGSGEGVTIIRANGFEYSDLQAEKGTVVGASNVEIRSLTIESDAYPNAGSWYGYAVGVYVPDVAQFKLTHVTVSAYDGMSASYGIYNYGLYIPTPGGGYYLPADLTLDTVRVSADYDDSLGGSLILTEGIFNNDDSILTMTNTEVAAGGSDFAVGVYNTGGHAYIYDSTIDVKGAAFLNYTAIRNQDEATLYMRNSRVIAGADNGQEGSALNGIYNSNSGLVQLFDSSITAAGSKTYAAGIRGDGDSAGLFAMTNVNVDTFGENYLNIGIHYEDGPVVIRDSHIYAHDGVQAIGLDFYDTGAPDHTITQTEILVEGATPSGEADPNSNSNIGVRISSEGLFKFIRDTIQVPSQFGAIPIGGVGLLNNGGGVIFENGTLNDMVMPAYMGMVHYFFGANTLTINNSEIYTCSDPMCYSVLVFPAAPPGASPTVLIGSTLLWGGPVVPPFTPPPSFVQCVLVYDETWTSFGPACP
jgi:hypothetical protein